VVRLPGGESALAEERNADGGFDRVWGLYVHDPQAAADLAVEVPYPQFATYTEELGVETARAANARHLFVADAHRYANPSFEADVGVTGGTVFNAVHREVVGRGDLAVQIDRQVDLDLGDATISSAKDEPTATAVFVHDELERRFGYDVCLYDGEACDSTVDEATNPQAVASYEAGGEFLNAALSFGVRRDEEARAGIAEAVERR
jgi:hypothetical protein